MTVKDGKRMAQSMESNKKERKRGMVQLRGGFSDTFGLIPLNKTIQIDEFDTITRTRISNQLLELLSAVLSSPMIHHTDYGSEMIRDAFCRALLNDVFCRRNTIPYGESYNWNEISEYINTVIHQAPYNEVLDLVEFSCRWIDPYLKMTLKQGLVFKTFNQLFEKEYVGYRFVDSRIIAITDDQEINAIEEACQNPYEGCRVQIQKALAILADRSNKDYKNSIKESISAVESICKVIARNEKAVLSTAIKQLEKQGVIIHPCLKEAFIKLYNYTSDQGGIRHAEKMFESNVTFEEAKFMLVSCSAFINYLIAVIAQE